MIIFLTTFCEVTTNTTRPPVQGPSFTHFHTAVREMTTRGYHRLLDDSEELGSHFEKIERGRHYIAYIRKNELNTKQF